MIASAGAWAAGISALLGIVAVLVKWAYQSSPDRKKKRRKNENEDISRAVRSGDAGWIAKWLRKKRDQSDG